MSHLETFYTLSLLTQIIHSIEELGTGFHKRWFLSKMPFWVFLSFEIVFIGFWMLILLQKDFPNRAVFQVVFLILMFSNGIEHLVWWRFAKRYVPGLATSPIHLIISLAFFVQTLM